MRDTHDELSEARILSYHEKNDLWNANNHVSLLRCVLELDKQLSEQVHSLVLPMPLECFLYFWCRVFSANFVCLTVNLTYFCIFLPFHYKPGINCVILVSAQLTTGIVCLAMKNIFHRCRPGVEVTNRKLLNPVIRLNRERFWSFPSGDSAQAACWAAVVGLSGFY